MMRAIRVASRRRLAAWPCAASPGLASPMAGLPAPPGLPEWPGLVGPPPQPWLPSYPGAWTAGELDRPGLGGMDAFGGLGCPVPSDPAPTDAYGREGTGLPAIGHDLPSMAGALGGGPGPSAGAKPDHAPKSGSPLPPGGAREGAASTATPAGTKAGQAGPTGPTVGPDGMPDLQKLFEVWVDSELKAQIIVFYNLNPGVIETMEGLARRLGLNPEALRVAVDDHVRLGLLTERVVGGKTVLVFNRDRRQALQELLTKAIQNRMEESP